MRLFICEKPSQAREIARFVGATQRGNGCTTGKDVAVTWCIGHLLEQVAPEFYDPQLKTWNIDLLPVLPQRWKMEVKSGTREQYQAVAAMVAKASEVVIATDADREGEVIAREVLTLAGYQGPVRRLWLSAFDDASVRKALARLLPGEKTRPMYLSGMGRSRADWLAGMNLTMALTKAFGTGGKDGVLHCGRVQTPVLGLIVRRERAIAHFVPKTHYVLQAVFEVRGTMVPMAWKMPAQYADKDGHCLDQKAVQAVAQKISGKTGRLTKVDTTRERELAPLLYSLGSLQREASARYGIKAQAVLDAAQALYEKHKATSYPRTDCEYLPLSMHGDAQGILSALSKADPQLARTVALTDLAAPGRAFNDAKVTAHHAIIPTGNPSVRMADMSSIEARVYDLVRRRYLAQFLGAFEFNKTVIDLACEGEHFGATGKMPLVQGWKRAYEGMDADRKPTKPAVEKDADDAPQLELPLPAVQVGDQAINRKALVQSTKTKPPKRYTEGTLLGAMESIDKEIDDPRLKKVMQSKEKAGIGTDATRAAIIEGLFKRMYIASEGKALKPTDKGNHLITLIERVIPEMADPVLTALWEDQLAKIESGELALEKFEGWLGLWLKEQIQKIRTQPRMPPAQTPQAPATAPNTYRPGTTHASNGSVNPAKPAQEPARAPNPCPACGKPLKRRMAGSGAFWGCSGYPACKTTLPDVEGAPGRRDASPAPQATTKASGPICSDCGKAMLVRNGARGEFWGCSGYPACKSTRGR